MTIQTIEEFADWCKEVDEISVQTFKQTSKAIIIEDLWDTNGMIVCELMVSAYDSNFRFGPMHADLDNGSIVIYEG